MEKQHIGYLLIAVGVAAVLFALSMDTSVETVYGGRINNIGLMQDKQNYLILGGISLISGLALALLGNSPNAVSIDHLRKCPACAEMIRLEASKCRFCSSDVVPMQSSSDGLGGDDTDRLNEYDLAAVAEFYQIQSDGSEFVFNDRRFPTMRDAVKVARSEVQH